MAILAASAPGGPLFRGYRFGEAVNAEEPAP